MKRTTRAVFITIFLGVAAASAYYLGRGCPQAECIKNQLRADCATYPACTSYLGYFYLGLTVVMLLLFAAFAYLSKRRSS